MQEAGIRTKGPHGLWFRSRTEAKWACLFEALRWKWQYEPMDLKHYIPDFLLQPQNLLLEVKPIPNLEVFNEYTGAIDKVKASGWKHGFVLVGTEPLWCETEKMFCLGLYFGLDKTYHPKDIAFPVWNEPVRMYVFRDTSKTWSLCFRETKTHWTSAFSGTRCEVQPKLHSEPVYTNKFKSILAAAQNKVQWRKRKRTTTKSKKHTLKSKRPKALKK